MLIKTISVQSPIISALCGNGSRITKIAEKTNTRLATCHGVPIEKCFFLSLEGKVGCLMNVARDMVAFQYTLKGSVERCEETWRGQW